VTYWRRLRSPFFKNFLRLPLALSASALSLLVFPCTSLRAHSHAQVYNKYESADTFEHVIESMHAFAAFPAPFRASGLGYREMLAVARAFVAANATAAAAALSARLTAPSSSSTADGGASSSAAGEQLDVCLALLRSFGAADAARASIDLRDIDAFVALVLDSDTLSTDEWMLPAPGAIIDQWHAIEAPSPVCVRLCAVCLSSLCDAGAGAGASSIAGCLLFYRCLPQSRSLSVL
jgi:hypothetical protein